MENIQAAEVFLRMADLCDIRGDNVFKVRALRNAAEVIANLPHDLEGLCLEPARLRQIKGIGEGIAKKILEIRETGTCREYEELKLEYPASILDLLKIEGVGPKKVRVFYEELGVRSVADLREAALAGKVRELPRMSEAAESKLLKAIREHEARAGRFLISWAEPVVEAILQRLEGTPGVKRLEPAGSFRRRRETVGDLDFLAVASDPAVLMDAFCTCGEVIVRGDTKASIRMRNGLQVDLRAVGAESFGAAMQYFTGSKAHNVEIRTRAVRDKLTVNEYGVYKMKADGSPGKRVAGETEEDVYAALGLPWIAPEIRENHGEVEAAIDGRLPRLIERKDLRGDVHMHTTDTDGSAGIEEMARAAAERGHEYIAITDHTQALTMVGGLNETRVRKQGKRIDAVNARLDGTIRVLKGTEMDILKDGTLDLKDDVLRELDVVIGSVHSHFGLPREAMTARVIRAIESGRVDIVAHPTGRLLLRREPFALDMDAVLRAAQAHGVAMEINAFPDRLDLSATHCRMALELGVKLVISTDAHTPEHLDLLHFGVENARRGWLEAKNVLNTRKADTFLRLLHKGHR